MKIISGSLGGSLVPTLKNAKYRPSTGRLKEAIFSILTSRNKLKDKIVLDLFSGTGSLGFEAISRGAKYATFIDIDLLHLNTARTFAEKHKLLDKTSFIRADSTNLGPTDIEYDLIFLDPPYGFGMVEKSLKSIEKFGWLMLGAMLVIEVGNKEQVLLPGTCNILDERVYGSSKLIIAECRRDVNDLLVKASAK